MKGPYIVSCAKSILRLIANHCPEPHVRCSLFRLSGILIGRGAYINMDTIFEDEFIAGTIQIGERVSVAKGVAFIASSHSNNSCLSGYGTGKFAPVVVENDVWIGTGAVILPGVVIGKFSIIGANAVVTRDVEPYSIITGVPGRKTGDVRERFDVA